MPYPDGNMLYDFNISLCKGHTYTAESRNLLQLNRRQAQHPMYCHTAKLIKAYRTETHDRSLNRIAGGVVKAAKENTNKVGQLEGNIGDAETHFQLLQNQLTTDIVDIENHFVEIENPFGLLTQ